MTKINKEVDMDDLIISINDIDIDMNANIVEGIGLYDNQFKIANTGTNRIVDNKNYTFHILDSSDNTLTDSMFMPNSELDNILNSDMQDTVINKKPLNDIVLEKPDDAIREEDFVNKEEDDKKDSYEGDESNVSKKKKNKSKNKALIITATTILLSASGGFTYTAYNEYKTEQIRLSELDKDNLDLKLIINTVDEYGGYTHQLNWKEVASVLCVKFNNYPQSISKNDILNICSLFLNEEENRIGDLGYVVNKLDIKKKDKERIFDYYDDLSEYGYTPEKLKKDSPQMEFINSIKDGAFESYKKTNILPSITIAQAILESNWGNSNLVKESNNLFGIKADASWKGDYVIFETKEFHNTMIKDKFRKYNNKSESIVDHSEFLKLNPRYEEGGVFEAKTYKSQALALQESGYSTAQDEHGNKTYADMLEQLIRQYNLQILDWEARYFSK